MTHFKEKNDCYMKKNLMIEFNTFNEDNLPCHHKFCWYNEIYYNESTSTNN